MATLLQFDLSETLAEVLAEPRFDSPSESWWDRFVERGLAEVARLFGALIEAVGGPVVAAFLALGVVGALALVVAVRLAGRRASVVEERIALDRLLETGADPDAFLEGAEEASRRGEYAKAVRLRFVGGVLDLGRRGIVQYEPGLTNAGIADQMGDETFDRLAEQFDAVAYGNADAGQAADTQSRDDWRHLRSPV